MARTDDELRTLSRDVLYEIQMMLRVTEQLGGQLIDPESSVPWHVEMALLEAFTVHARSLIHFLWRDPPSRYPDDAFAADFFDEGEWAQIRPQRESTLAGIDRRIGAEIAHLSYARSSIPKDDRMWPFGEIAASIGRCLRVYIREVPPLRVQEGFQRDAWQATPAFLRGPAAVSWPPDGMPRAPQGDDWPADRPEEPPALWHPS